MHEFEDLKKEVTALIQLGETEATLDALNQHAKRLPNRLQKTLITLQGQFHSLEQNHISFTISQESYNVGINKIHTSILTMLEQLDRPIPASGPDPIIPYVGGKDNPPVVPKPQAGGSTFWEKYNKVIVGLTAIVTLLGGIAKFSGFTLKDFLESDSEKNEQVTDQEPVDDETILSGDKPKKDEESVTGELVRQEKPTTSEVLKLKEPVEKEEKETPKKKPKVNPVAYVDASLKLFDLDDEKYLEAEFLGKQRNWKVGGQSASFDFTYVVKNPLLSKSKMRMFLESSVSNYVYLLGTGETDRSVNKLFPYGRFDAEIDAGTGEIALPSKDLYFEMDETTGVVYILALFSQSPLDIDKIKNNLGNRNRSLSEQVEAIMGDVLFDLDEVNFKKNRIEFKVPFKDTNKEVLALIIKFDQV